jgi:hypothetical protein
MFTILLIILIVFALGGFGHTGYRRGWYGDGYVERSEGPGAWGGGGLGLILLLVVLFLVFSHAHHHG